MTAATELPRWTRVAAYALATDDDARVLLVRIAPGYPASGVWTLPGGGLDFGEDPRDGVLRELSEETGLAGEIDSLAFVDSITAGPITERGRRYGPYHSVRIVYGVRTTGGSLRDEVDESTDAAAWLTRDEIDKLPRSELVDAALRHLDGHEAHAH